MQLDKQIVAARKKKGYTQEELADLAQVTVRTIQRIESGESVPRPYTLKTIAAALEISFETLTATGSAEKNAAVNLQNDTASTIDDDSEHALKIICLSCFSYIIVPFVHFLIPAHMLKKSKLQHPAKIAFAKRVIRGQLYWKAALWLIMLAVLAYNFIRAAYFQKSHIISYLLPFFLMYFLNAVIITINLLSIKKLQLHVSSKN
jgi:XRE family transcriptional regulator, regulator of sulfur utilization